MRWETTAALFKSVHWHKKANVAEREGSGDLENRDWLVQGSWGPLAWGIGKRLKGKESENTSQTRKHISLISVLPSSFLPHPDSHRRFFKLEDRFRKWRPIAQWPLITAESSLSRSLSRCTCLGASSALVVVDRVNTRAVCRSAGSLSYIHAHTFPITMLTKQGTQLALLCPLDRLTWPFMLFNLPSTSLNSMLVCFPALCVCVLRAYTGSYDITG